MRYIALRTQSMQSSSMIAQSFFDNVVHSDMPKPDAVVDLFRMGGFEAFASIVLRDVDPARPADIQDIFDHRALEQFAVDCNEPGLAFLDTATGEILSLATGQDRPSITYGGHVLSVFSLPNAVLPQGSIDTMFDVMIVGCQPVLTSTAFRTVLGLDLPAAVMLSRGQASARMSWQDISRFALYLLAACNRTHHGIMDGQLASFCFAHLGQMARLQVQPSMAQAA